MKTPKALPNQAQLKTLFDYDPDTGVLAWKYRAGSDGYVNWFNRTYAGKPAGCLARTSRKEKGYLVVHISQIPFLVHRVIWMMCYGEDPGKLQIDHVNLNKQDNRRCNLRLASNSDNMCNNVKTSHRGKTVRRPYKGVTLRPSGNWVASIMKQGERHYLGTFATAEEARDAYHAAAHRLHGEFARTQ